MFAVEDLQPDTTYKITSFIFDSEYEKYEYDHIIVKTMTANYTPQVIPRKNITLVKVKMNETKKGVNVDIEWKPNEG